MVDDLWEEWIDGQLVTLPPITPLDNIVRGNIFGIFKTYLRKKRDNICLGGTAVQLTDKDRFIPDFMVVCDRDKIKSRWVAGAPDLVVEILSPSTAKNDKWYKKNVYGASGVPEYWIVSPKEKSIEVYLLRDGRYVLDNLYMFYTEEELEDLEDKVKDGLVTEFKCHLYDDLSIRLEDIFGALI